MIAMAKIIGYIVNDDGTMQPVTETVGDATPSEAQADTGGEEPKPYTKWLKADLEAEVDRRNEGRDDDDLIEVEGKGTVADLAAALDADDAAQADTGE